MRHLFRFSLLLMFATVAVAPAPAQTQGGVDILLAKARSLEARGRIDLAVENWQKVLLVNPNQTEALAGLARGAKENGQTEQERSYLDRLRKINPRDPEIAAVEKLRVFTSEDRSRLDEAGRLAMQHKPDAAMKIYREVLGDRQPPPGKWAQPFYETEAASTGGRAKAISQLRQLCAQNPNYEAYRLWLASLLTYDPKTRLEGLQLLESIKDSGTAEQARAPWRQALLWEKDNPEALAPIEAYLQRYPDPDLQPIAAALQAKQQQNIAAQDREQGFKALQNKNVAAAEAKFTEVLHQSPNDVNAISGLGYVRLDQKRFSDALNLFDHARALAPARQDVRDGYDSARFWLAIQRGSLAQQQNQPAVAIAAYQEALSLRPLDIGALLGVANALVRERKFADAESKFQQVLHQAPNNADAMAGLGFVRLNEGKFDDAANLFAQARKLDPARKDVAQGYQNATFWGIMNRAAALLNQNRAKDAVAAYQQAVQLNPNDKDALLGLANASVRAADFPLAAKTYYRLTASDPNDESSWLGLIQAQVGEHAPQTAIATSQHIPSAVKLKMEARSDFLSEMALIYYLANQPAEGDLMLHHALQVARSSDTDDALSLRLQIAGAFMDQGKIGQAIEIYRQAVQLHPNNPSGWESLVGAYTRIGDFAQAIAFVRSMPQRSYDAAVGDTGFLDSLAILYSNRGQCAEAEDLLHRSLAVDQKDGRRPARSTQLQLADIWMRQHVYGQAEDLYRNIVTTNADSADAWRGLLVAMHLQRADQRLVAEIPHIPPAVRSQLEMDPTFLILEASAYSSSERNQAALTLLEKARSRYTAQHKDVPAPLDIQTAWTMLAVSDDAPGLGNLLLNDKGRGDLTSQQRDAIESIWSTWAVRRAERAFESKPELAFSILTDAGHQYPGDRNINATLASLYLKRHDKQKALDVFQTWGMKDAQPGDFRMAAGAALSAHKFDSADQFLRRGLAQFPNDPELMHMSARQDIARGNYDEGERELRSALVAIQAPDTSDSKAKLPALPSVRENSETSSVDAGSSLIAHDGSSAGSNSLQSAQPCRPQAARGGAGSEARIRPISLVFMVPQAQTSGAQNSSSQDSSGQTQAQKQQQKEQMEGEVETVDSRNTPFINVGAMGTGRIGDPGFDQLIIDDNLLGAAYTASNRVRLGVEAHGIYATSGTPDGTSTQLFGTLPAGAMFGEQSKIGYSGLAQLSTDTFGMSFGTTPQGFAVHNLIGGIRYRPGNSWLTVEGVRDSVKDSLLSYAGSRDPGTGLRWGGVVANTGTVKFDSTPSTSIRYKPIGEYASGSYSYIQGLNVPNNWNVSGNGGLYWQMVPGLTIGVNANAMHYDRNLNFFSFGQGGYFSPQKYFLASMPISWYSRHPRFEYQVRFSGGVQYLHQASSLFYPILPPSANVTQGVYTSNNSTTPNYDADIRLGYRVAPHVYFDMFATANNAQNYYTQSAGFSLKFMFDRIPTSTDIRVNSIPDWTGKQPYSVR